MALSDIFGGGGLLGGGSSDPLDIYGDLFTEKQKAALQQRQASEGLLKLAGAFGAAAQPSRMPTSFLGTLGQAAGAMAGSGDEAAKTALSGMKVAEDVRTSKQQREWTAKLLPSLVAKLAALEKANGLPQGSLTSQIPGAGAAPTALPGMTTSATAADALVPAGAPQPPGAPPPNAIGMPPALPGGMPGVDSPYGAPPGPQAGLLPPPPGAPPGQVPGMGLLAAGGGAPPPFQMASSTLTGGGIPGAPDLSNFTAADAGGGGDAGDDWQRVKPLIRKYESGGRNVEQGVVGPRGGYNPSVGRVTGPSSASGYYQMIDPTWRAAAAKVGIDTTKYPRAINAPEELQDKAAEALYREQGLRPWAPYNRQLAAATGYRGGAGAPDLSNLAGDAGGGGDAVPGLSAATVSNMPEQLSTLSAITQLLGLKDPFGPMLETHYKSPGYIAEAERARTKAQKDIEYEMDPLIIEQRKRAEYKVDMELKPRLEEAVQKLQSPILKERLEAKADIDRVTKAMEQTGAAALRPNDATVLGPDGVPVTQRLTDLEFAQRQKDRADRMARGDMTPKPGDIVGTPVLSPEETAAQTQRGKSGQEMTTVQVWTPNGLVSQQMTNLEAAARRKMVGERGPAGPPQVGDIVDAPALTEPEKKIAGALGEDFVALRRQAQAARDTISSTHDLRAKLDSGIFTGLDANWSLFAAKLGETLGWTGLSNPEKVKNTEVYISGIGKEVLAMVKELRPASNVDLQFAERMAGGQNMSAGAIRELLDMRERYARLAVERHNEEARGMNPGAFTGFRREIPIPPPYQQKSGTTPGGLRWKE